LLENLKEKGIKQVPGKDIFTFYDTYGFPLDLLDDMAKDRGLALDMKGFEDFMNDQKERARKSWKGDEVSDLTFWEKVDETPFVGRESDEVNTRLKLIATKDDGSYAALSGEAVRGKEYEFVLQETPFYAEAGGQVGDRGVIRGRGGEFEVRHVYYPKEGVVSHKGMVKSGSFKEGEEVLVKIDSARRKRIARHHTATHLLHYALRYSLGDHVKQAGSLVSDDRFRFDFTHFKGLTSRELDRIEDIVNAKIIEDHPVKTEIMGYDEACKKGAIAIFEEKYGDTVRVISISHFSKELCGGTHVSATGEIGYFRILSESSVGANLRRIEAVCGDVAYRYAREERNKLLELCSILKSPPEESIKKLESLLKELKESHKALERSREESVKKKLEDFNENLKHAGEFSYLILRSDGKNPEELRRLHDVIKTSISVDIILLASNFNNRALLAGFVDKKLGGKVHAGDIVRAMAEVVGGKGGGNPLLGQGGGNKPEKLGEALKKGESLIIDILEG